MNTGIEGKGAIMQGMLLSESSGTILTTSYWLQAKAFSPGPSSALGKKAASLKCCPCFGTGAGQEEHLWFSILQLGIILEWPGQPSAAELKNGGRKTLKDSWFFTAQWALSSRGKIIQLSLQKMLIFSLQASQAIGSESRLSEAQLNMLAWLTDEAVLCS